MFNNLFNNFDSDVIIGLNNEMKAIYISSLFKKKRKNIIVVTNTLFEANKLAQALENYCDETVLFPMDDFLTSEAIAISPELKSTRIETLIGLCENKKNIIITNLMGYLRFLPTKEIVQKNIVELEIGNEIKLEELKNKLFDLGYVKETFVNKTGEISIRGYVIDIYPIGEENPVRIEFWGDEIESIRYFDVDTQRTKEKIRKIKIKPNTEFLTCKNIDTFGMKQSELKKIDQVVNISTFEDSICFFDNYDQLVSSYNMLVEEMMTYSISNNNDPKYEYMFDFNKIKNKEEKYFNDFDNLLINKQEQRYNCQTINSFSNDIKETNERLNKLIKNYKVVICLNDRFKCNHIIEKLENKNIVLTNENELFDDKINLIIKKINQGFIYENYYVISENEIFNKKIEYKYKNKFRLGTKIRDINKLNVGDYVVHSAHGIGRYCGIKSLIKNGLKKDYLHIEYKDNDKLYIPVEKIEFISKYSSREGVEPKLNKLGSVEWTKTKLKAKKRIEDIAGELLKLYALREASKGFAFSEDSKEQYEFEKEFPYNETKDQLKVIEEIKKDMEKGCPMDRLLCGDVGYGKTEVAFRAIFKAIMDNKQVAILCPTTILSSQHFNNALERFKSYAVEIQLLNRFVPNNKVKSILERLENGRVDILIGTHRILSDDIKFKDLGLLVIDEEQRFGVKHKEKIKQLKNSVDVLTLSATPIPRTLQMSMVGIRNLSLIETPPVDRYPIQTYVLAENNQIIKDAIYKELSRNGQCFILFNNIKDLESKKMEIMRLVPEANIVTAHGKLSKNELESIMTEFIERKYDVLLCTTIIETGIDIPNANTLIVYDADHFGLSQLYQLRGRVGRSNKIAYCYLMYEKTKILSEVAVKRLQAIKEFTELGSGFSIAMRDLSIRGAGDILGSEQAGFVDTIGVEMFMKMLEDEIAKLKGIKVKEREDYNPLIEVETSISNEFVEDEEIKIEIHKMINKINDYESLEKTKEELEDRFGKLSDNIVIYMYQEMFEKMATNLNISKVVQTKNSIELFIPETLLQKINIGNLFAEVTTKNRSFRFTSRNKQLVIILDIVKLDKHFIYYLIELLETIKKYLDKI